MCVVRIRRMLNSATCCMFRCCCWIDWVLARSQSMSAVFIEKTKRLFLVVGTSCVHAFKGGKKMAVAERTCCDLIDWKYNTQAVICRFPLPLDQLPFDFLFFLFCLSFQTCGKKMCDLSTLFSIILLISCTSCWKSPCSASSSWTWAS